MKRLQCLGAGLFLAALSASAADKRILLIAGTPSHPPGMHEFRAGCLLLQKCLAQYPGVQGEVYSNGWPSHVEGGKSVDDNSVFDGAAAVMIYADGGGGHPAIQRDHTRVLDGLAAKGVGLGFSHFGVEVPKGEPGAAMHRWVGGYYEDRYSVNPMWWPEFEKLPNHPITRGVKPFSDRDEWYFNMRWTEAPGAREKIQPLLVATPSDKVRKGPYVYPSGPYPHIVEASGREETMMWSFERPDGGRGFGFTGGHTHSNWGHPDQRKIVLNALLWIAHVDVPANGVESLPSEADLKANLDPKK